GIGLAIAEALAGVLRVDVVTAVVHVVRGNARGHFVLDDRAFHAAQQVIRAVARVFRADDALERVARGLGDVVDRTGESGTAEVGVLRDLQHFDALDIGEVRRHTVSVGVRQRRAVDEGNTRREREAAERDLLRGTVVARTTAAGGHIHREEARGV